MTKQEWIKNESNPAQLAKMLDSISGLTVIAAHMGGYSQWAEAWEKIIGRKDVYVGTWVQPN